MSRYLNPFTDRGFKTIFGQEISKDILIDFLNALLKGERVISDITFLDKEVVAQAEIYRTLIYDLYCQTDTGEYIVVEMQNKVQSNLIERAVYYAASAIERQGTKGRDWDYHISAVYTIFFTNFRIPKLEKHKLLHNWALMDRDTGEHRSDLMRMIFIELPLMTKEVDECENDFERWIYVLKNMETFERMPFAAQNSVFARLGEIADIYRLTPSERANYMAELKQYRDSYAVYNGVREEGREEGRIEGREEGREEGRIEERTDIALNLKQSGIDRDTIIKCTGVDPDNL